MRHQGLGWSLQAARSFGGCPGVAESPSLDGCGASVAHGSREEGRGTALPLPHRPGHGLGEPSLICQMIPKLLTHNVLSWVTTLSSWLCYHFLVGFVRFLSTGSTLWAEQCESDRGINVTFRKKKKKSIVGKHLYFNKDTFELEGFPMQKRSRAPEQLCQEKQGTASLGNTP